MSLARVLRAVGGVSAIGLVAALAACSSSPASRFYTLGGTDAATRTASPASFYLEVSPVDMPPQVAKNQMVVQDGSAQVRVLEDERWASLPADEVRRALSADLSQRLGAIDVFGTPHPDGVPVYRVKVNVQRFESSPGRRALIDAVWSVRGVNNQAVLTCRTVAEQPVDAGYDALVAGHRRAVDQLASEISAGVRTVSSVPVPLSSSVSSSATAGKAGKVTARTPAVLPCPAAAMSANAAPAQ
ncbi:ABC-type transport auxiliary lipoprotein component [Caballeronia sp. SBC1]|uniref:PqiC family protein n=1 Tax=Caballeronia sp. SBC1 TaxID=2705548 RepID=UPI0014075FC1|nr:PqiC family protein [Caballeronia sp. SBC1]QIN60499.1 ABC-type transport auxiliary lipoprotein component [Caballeronia sp. SBC1]